MNLSNLFNGICVALASFILFLYTANTSFASTFHLFSEKANINVGETIPVNVVIDTKGESVNGVSAFLSYPSDKLEVAWISYSEAFPVQAEESYENGIIKISRGSFTGEVGNVTIATIGLRGKVKGAATVSFINESAAPRTRDSSDSLNLGESSGKTFTVKTAQTIQKTVQGSQIEPNIFATLLEKFLFFLGK